MFREGALVTALRRGHWLVLDELNLAPTEVLEALNRCACQPRPASPCRCQCPAMLVALHSLQLNFAVVLAADWKSSVLV